jgi:hypothetical protein
MDNTESLIIELDARTKKLDAKLDSTNVKLDKISNSTEKAGRSLVKFSKAASLNARKIRNAGASVLAFGSAISAMTLKASSSRKGLEQFARQAKTTEESFQSLSFATKQYGIDAEQIADISKDIADKVGEFSAAGTGTFQDYADVMKLTKEQARSTADEFESLSSEEVIGKMVSRMEDAGVSGNKMTFVLESMGNDLSKLQPLFANNSAELKTMRDRFNAVNSSMSITSGQAEKLKGVSTSFDLMTSSLGNAATAVSATIAPIVDEFFNDVIDVVPTATQAIIDFTNSFLDAENITSISAVNKEIAESQDQIAKKTELIANTNGRNQRVQKILLDEENERLSALEAQLVVLKEQESLADARKLTGSQIGGTSGGQGDTPSGTGDELQEISDKFKDEETLLTEKLERDLLKVGDNNLLKMQLNDQYWVDIVEMDLAAENKITEATAKALSDRAKLTGRAAKAEIAMEKSVAKNSIELINGVLGGSKAAAIAGLVVQKASALSANATATLSGSVLAFASQLIPGDPTSVVRAEAARDYTLGLGSINAGLIVATGLTQGASIANGGGGGSSISSSGGGSSTSSTPAQEAFQPETTSLELSSAGSGGSQAFNVTVPSGDELGIALANWMKQAQIEGTI